MLVPPYYDDFPDGVGLRELEVPTLALDALEAQRSHAIRIARDITANHLAVTLFDPAEALCIGDRCQPILDDTWLYRDGDHMTPDGAAVVAPSLEQYLGDILIGDDVPS